MSFGATETGIPVGAAVKVGRHSGCAGQHTIISDVVQVMGFPLSDHVLIRSERVNGPTKCLEAWIPLEDVEVL